MTCRLDEVMALRLRLQAWPWPDPDAAYESLRELFGTLIEGAQRIHEHRVADLLTGLVMLTAPRPRRFGRPEAKVVLLLDPEVPDARSWAATLLEEISPHLGEHCTLGLRLQDRSLLEILEPLGFGPTKLWLVGSVEAALARMRSGTIDPRTLGVDIVPLELEQVGRVNDLMRDFFLANPHLGFGDQCLSAQEQAEIDAEQREQLEREVRGGQQTHFTISRNGEILGYCGFYSHPAHPLLGSCAGANIVLLPPLQGMGLGRATYLHLFERMHSLGLGTVYGLTSNPAVIHLGRQQGRVPRSILMRRDGPFIPRHFIPS